MKRALAFLVALFSVLSLSVPTDLSFASTKAKKQVVQGKAKTKAQHKKVKKTALKRTKKVVYKRPRYARNVNKPVEGEILKLEGMVKDLNE